MYLFVTNIHVINYSYWLALGLAGFFHIYLWLGFTFKLWLFELYYETLTRVMILDLTLGSLSPFLDHTQISKHKKVERAYYRHPPAKLVKHIIYDNECLFSAYLLNKWYQKIDQCQKRRQLKFIVLVFCFFQIKHR